MTIDRQGNADYGYGQVRLQLSGAYTDAHGKDQAVPETTVDERGDMLALRQRVDGAAGVSSVRFTVSVPDGSDVILPAWSGIRLSKDVPDIHLGFTRLTYPDLWQAQMLLIQGANGGLLVYAADDGSRFKALTVRHEDGQFFLTLETVPQAPFDAYGAFETAEWRLVPYAGGWEQGARLYRDYMDAAFGLPAINAAKPAWAAETGLIVLTDIEEPAMLDVLAGRVDPAKTLLHVPGWRRERYDVNYPDYTPDDTIRARVDYAHRLGFRVGVHFNMLGTDTGSPEYRRALADAHSLDAATKEPIMETYSAFGKQYAFAQINPASRAWRDILADKAAAAVAALGVDAIHLDQSLLCFNDGRGLVDGMTSMQGNVALQRDLAAALPGVAFSGEGLNEYNVRYASWLQMHVYGLDSGSRTWEARRFGQIIPLGAALFGDTARLYHYPAMPTTLDEDYYAAWYEAGARMGHLPTLMRIGSGELRKPNAAMRRALADAAERMKR